MTQWASPASRDLVRRLEMTYSQFHATQKQDISADDSYRSNHSVRYHAPQLHCVGNLEKLQANDTGNYFDGPAEYLFDGF